MIFVSYSLKDEAPFSSLCMALEAANLPYWKQPLKAGASLKEQLRDAISQCGVCIFIATRSSVTSQWCLNEIGAFWGAGKRIILYAANPDIENKLPPLFKGDYWTCDAREVIRQVREELEELAKDTTPKRLIDTLKDSGKSEAIMPAHDEEKEPVFASLEPLRANKTNAGSMRSEDWSTYREGGQYGPESYSGEIVFNDGSKARFNWLSCPIGLMQGADIEEGKAPFSKSIGAHRPSREIGFNAIAKIDFIDLTAAEREQIRELRLLYPLRKATVIFRDGTSDTLFLYSSSQSSGFWKYRSQRERGSLNDAKTISFGNT